MANENGELTAQTVELLQTLIRNECVNDGTPESGQEVRNSDVLQTMLEGSGLDIETFEPTPGRGAPRAQQYTGVPQQQAVSGDPEADPIEDGSGLIPGGQSNAPVIEEPTTDNAGFVDDLTAQEPTGEVAPWVVRTLIDEDSDV